MKTRITLILIAGLLVGSAGAGVIFSDDFDSITTGSWAYINTAQGTGDTDWESDGTTSYQSWVANDGSYAGGEYPSAAHSGNYYVDLNNAYIGQALGETYVENNVYTLSFWITTHDDPGNTNERYYAFFTDGGVSNGIAITESLKSSGYQSVPNDDTWHQYTLEYTATATDAGKAVGVSFFGYYETYIDDVQLSVIPEPATLGLVAVLGGGILVIRRKFMI